MTDDIEYLLHDKQKLALNTSATEILFGGAAGPGKSHLLRIAAIGWALVIPSLQIYLFRRKYPDLYANHMDGPTSFRSLLAPLMESGHVTINTTRGEIVFWNGAKIHLCHCQHEQDIYNYQGAEIHVLLIDELTHFTEHMYRFLRGRVRLGGLQLPEGWKGFFPRVLCASNPGNIGHAWVKRTWIDFSSPMDITATTAEEGGLLRQYIPALLEDNPTLTENDPEYERRLEGLGSPELVKAMRYGIWDITAGAALEKLSREKHMVRNFRVPSSWTKFMSIDWGSSKPFAVGWFCVADDNLELVAKDNWPTRYIPKGAVIMYREYYGWNGKPNEGCRLESFEVARRILEIEEEADEIMDYRVGDDAMWSKIDGPSVQERMYDATNGRFVMQKSRKDRISNYQEIRARLVGEDDQPMFYITESCKHFWRTMPDLQLDELHPEKGPESQSQEDHCLIAGTGIITEHGIEPIEQIITGTKVLTTEGFLPCINLGITGIKPVLKIVFADAEYYATGNHPFLNCLGAYVRLDELRAGDNLLCIKSYQILSKSGWGRVIGCVVSIFNVAAKGFTELFGSITTAVYQKAIMFIIKTEIGRIMIFPILSLYQLANTCPYICAPLKDKPIVKCKSKESDLSLVSGMGQKKEGSGIVELLREERSQDLIKSNVSYAAKNLWQRFKRLFPVQKNVRLKNGEKNILGISVEQKRLVYNLHVPKANNFVLSNGVIVHNCYDSVAYALASRPYITTERDRIKEELRIAKKMARK